MAGAPNADLASYGSQIENYVSRLLGSYPDTLRRMRIRGQKEFNDPVWKTVILYPLEIAVLDSPLVQRLRWIRQLGVAEYVFPGAGHTRFQHSIGTLHMVDRLIQSINWSSPNTIEDGHRRLLRLTALCHDVGHGAMSHVSENALVLVDECERLRLQFGREHGLDNPPKLSEIAAYYMLGSPAFASLLDAAISASNDHVLPEDAQTLMKRAVVGLPIADEIPQLQELISGPFDGDKLDYMTRDAQMAGVPVVTDIPRLVQKVRSLAVSQDRLPEEIAKTVVGGKPQYVMLGISHSGGRTLDELMLGRTLLFDKVYRHHKVRALEAMVANTVVSIAKTANCHPALVPLSFTDEQLLDVSVGDIEAIAGRTLTAEEQANASIAVRFATNAKVRDLLVRAFAFSTRMPLDSYTADEAQRAGLVDLLRTVASPDARREFVESIANELVAIASIADPGMLEAYPPATLASWIWLDPPESSRQLNVLSRAYLITEDGQPVKFRDDSAESKGWADAYLQARDVGYIFAPRDLANLVFLASEKVVRERFGVRIPVSMVDYAKQVRTDLAEVREKLAAAGHYSTSPPDLRPAPYRLTRADVPGVLRRTIGNLQAYGGPAALPDGQFTPMEAGRVSDWVQQFESDDLIDAALRAVEQIRVIGRPEVVASVETFLVGNEAFANATICPLGGPKDSSYVNTYFAQDVTSDLGLVSRDLPVALLHEHPIVFVDDFIGSGRQAVDILEGWLGVDRTGDLGEDREQLPDPTLVERLRERPLAFVFAAGTDAGANHLRTRAAELGLDVNVTVSIKEGSLPRADGVTYSNADQAVAFREACVSIGHQLLSSQGVEEDKVPERVLGYGNQGFLLAFPFNTPAQTLTALWSRGSANGFDWLPLLPRRRKT